MISPHPAIQASPIARRFTQLVLALQEHAELGRAQPYKLAQSDWRARHPQLESSLLRLGDAQVDLLMADAQALIALVARAVPAVGRLARLVGLPHAHRDPRTQAPAHHVRKVPGCKVALVEACTAALGMPSATLIEWCDGKGHLGHRLGLEGGMPVSSLEIDARLCEAGRAQARRARADHRHFVTVDVLGWFVRLRFRGRHAVGLPAALLRGAADEGATAPYLAPCRFRKSADASQAGLSGEGRLVLAHDDLRLAVSDSVTAAPREIRVDRLGAAWILGLRAITGVDCLSMRSSGMRPRGDSIRAGFRRFCGQAAAANGLSLEAGIDSSSAEREARVLEHRVRRLVLPRLAFRRALKLWLTYDRARFVEQHGYRVSLSAFCARRLTPRNVLIAAGL